MFGEILGLAGGLIGAIGGASARSESNRQLERLIKEKKALNSERMGLAKTIFGGRMPGATAMENNILSNQANTLSTVEKNATDAGQVLGLAGQIQGNTNNAYQRLQQDEAADYQRRYGVLNSAYENSDQNLNDVISMKGAQQQNNGATWQELSNFGFGLANFSMAGGLDGFKKKSNGMNPQDRLALNTLGNMGLKW